MSLRLFAAILLRSIPLLQLACALEREARDEELVLIYVSLAQTCADLKLYRQAIEYYEKEISHRTDKTQVNRGMLYKIQVNSDLIDIPEVNNERD